MTTIDDTRISRQSPDAETDPQRAAGDAFRDRDSREARRRQSRNRNLLIGVTVAPLAALASIAMFNAARDENVNFGNDSGADIVPEDDAANKAVMLSDGQTGPSPTYLLGQNGIDTGSEVAADLNSRYNMGLTGGEIQQWGQVIDDHNSPNGPLQPGVIEIPQEPQRSHINQ